MDYLPYLIKFKTINDSNIFTNETEKYKKILDKLKDNLDIKFDPENKGKNKEWISNLKLNYEDNNSGKNNKITKNSISKKQNKCKFQGSNPFEVLSRKRKRGEPARKCGCSHEKTSEENYTEQEANDNKEKVENEKVNIAFDSTTKLNDAANRIKSLTGNDKILPNNNFDISKPSSLYKDSSSFEDAFENILKDLEISITKDDKSITNNKIVTQIVSSMTLIRQFLENENGIVFNNKENNNDKSKRLAKLKSKYNLLCNKLNNKLAESNVADKTKEMATKGIKEVPEVDFSNNNELQSENEQSVIDGIKELLGEEPMTLKINDGKLTSTIDSDSISESSENYVDALNALDDRINSSKNKLSNDVDSLANIANILHKAIISRNGNSDNHAITKALNKIYTSLYKIIKSSSSGANISQPINLDHIQINENEQDNTDAKLKVNQSDPDDLYDDIFGLDENGKSFAKNNLKRISSTYNKEMKSVSNADRASLERKVKNTLKKIDNNIKTLASNLEKTSMNDLPNSMNTVDHIMNLCEMYKSLASSLSSNNFGTVDNLDSDIDSFNPDSKVYKIINTVVNQKITKMLQAIKSSTDNDDILPFDGKSNEALNPSLNDLSKSQNALEPNEVVKIVTDDGVIDLDAAFIKVFSLFKAGLKAIKNSKLVKSIKSSSDHTVADTAESLVKKIHATSPLSRTPEDHALVKVMCENTNSNIDITDTESYDDIVYDSIVGVLESIKEETNDPDILPDNIDDAENIISPKSLVAGANSLKEVTNYIDIQHRLNKNIKKLCNMTDKSIGTSANEDIETACSMIGNLNSMLSNKNTNKESNNKLLNKIIKNNENAKPNTNVKSSLLKNKLRKIRRRRKNKKTTN